MYANNNKEIINEIAREDYKVHRIRNMMAVLAIALTALLVTVVCTSGIGSARAMSSAMGASPGPGADSAAIIGTEEQYEEIQKLPQVDWAAIARDCSTTTIHNREMLGLMVKLLAVEPDYYEKNYAELINGRYPEAANEMVLSDTMRDRLGLSGEPGESMRLHVVVLEQGREVDMVITGYYSNPLRSITDYEEIFTVRDFITTYNPEMLNGSYTIYVKLNNLEPLKLKNDIEEKLLEIKELVGAEGISYKMMGLGIAVILPFAAFLLLVMVSGYFLIYNVFHISIINEIRFFGLLKTIGTTGRQLKKLLKYQMHRQAVIGILLGMGGGFLLGVKLTPTILNALDKTYMDFYQVPNLGLVALTAAAFSYLTVSISCRKPFRTASSISPIEAVKYTGKKKNIILSVVSFALSGVIFLTVYNVTIGYQVEEIAARHSQTDIKVVQVNAGQPREEEYVPMREGLAEDIGALPFVEQVDLFYQARTDMAEEQGANSYAEMKLSGPIEGDIRASLGETYDYLLNERGNFGVPILGMEPKLLGKEAVYRKVLDGQMDERKFATGEYVIYQNIFSYYDPQGSDDHGIVRAGDKLTLSFYRDDTGEYLQKELEVLAVIGSDGKPIYNNSHMTGNVLIMPTTLFKEIYPDAGQMISELQITTADGDKKEQRDTVERLMLEEYNFQLKLESMWDNLREAREGKRSMTVMGLFLAGIFGMIGIANMVNTLTTDIMARKMEYAGMQSVGMTRRQLFETLLGQSAKLCIISILVMLPAGAWMAAQVAGNSTFTGFSVPAYAQAAALTLLMSMATAFLVAAVMTKVLNRKSIVERLREAE